MFASLTQRGSPPVHAQSRRICIMSSSRTAAKQWSQWFVGTAMGSKEPAPALATADGGAGLQLAPQVTQWLEQAHKWRPEKLLEAAHKRCTATPFSGKSTAGSMSQRSSRPPCLSPPPLFTLCESLPFLPAGCLEVPSMLLRFPCSSPPVGGRPPPPSSAALVCEDCLRAASMRGGRGGGGSGGRDTSFENGKIECSHHSSPPPT